MVGEICVEKGAALLTTMPHTHRDIGRFLIIQIHFSYIFKVLDFFSPNVSDEFIYMIIFVSSLGHSRHIEDESFLRKNKFQPHITLFSKYLLPYIIIECKMYYIFLRIFFYKI